MTPRPAHVALLGALAVFTTGCFDSLINGACQSGFVREGASCVARSVTDAGPDPDVDAGPDASPPGDAGTDTTPPLDGHPTDGGDAQVCVLPEVQCPAGCKDLQLDPDNCGSCGHVCASGLCSAAHCVGEPWGHIVAIGHDYQSFHPAMARVLGNAAALGSSVDLKISWWPADHAHAGPTAALTSALGTLGRPWHPVALPVAPAGTALAGIDVLIVDEPAAEGVATFADGAVWATELDAFLHRGGVVIVVEGLGGTAHQFAAGAALFTSPAPLDVTGEHTVLVNPADAVADHVLAPYLAETTSVQFPGATSPVVTTTDGRVIVFHLVR